jgi:NADH:ubiquinone oxidoreductase subunit F (NADH-binding)
MTGKEICDVVLATALGGRDGSGFHVGRKLNLVRNHTASKKIYYLYGDEVNRTYLWIEVL